MVIAKSFRTEDSVGVTIIKGILKKEGKPVVRKIKLLDDDGSDISVKQSDFIIKAKTHEELEIEIQSRRILRVLDEAIDKLQIAHHLFVLTENQGTRLRHYLPDDDVEFILDSCNKYVTPDLDAYDSFISEGGRSFQRMSQQRPLFFKECKLDINVAQSIDIIFKCKELMQNLEQIAFGDGSLSSKFMEGIRQLREAAARRLSVSALDERRREKELRIAWKDNTEAKVLIDNIQAKLDKQTEELEIELNVKNELIDTYRTKIDNMTEKFKADIKKRVTDSEKSMVQNSRISDERQTGLVQEAKERAQEYQTLLESHIVAEKILRAKRFKVEAQLASWLAKYDTDIGDLQAELEELNKLYNEEMEELNELQQKFDEQDEEYVELMAERDEYQKGIDDAKAYQFLMSRSARRIQRYWRAYRERKMLRKKARKGKKKKKSAEGEEGGGSAKGKKKGKGKDKPIPGKADPNANLEAMFKGDILDDISTAPIPPNP